MVEDPPETSDQAGAAGDPSAGLHGRWYVAIATVTLARALAVALLPLLLIEAPVALVLLSPAAADLILAAPLMAPWLFFVAAMVAAMGQAAIAYHFGRALGGHALLWLQSRSLGTKRMTARLLVWIERASPLVLLTIPGLTASALAGTAGVRARRFYGLVLIGNALWTVGCFAFGSALTEQLDALYGFIGEHVFELTAVAVTVVGIQTLWSRRRRRKAAARALQGDGA